MKNKQTNLEQMKGQNPFRVPEGYMEGLTSQIMDQLPEKSKVEAHRVSMAERIRPWLYLAAVFAGLGLFFDVLMGFNQSSSEGENQDSLLVHSQMVAEGTSLSNEALSDADAEYLEYIESQYASDILEQELAQIE